ncbi:arylsulfotransferase family protein, partial [Candidatus Altiarchaeota archaeon]
YVLESIRKYVPVISPYKRVFEDRIAFIVDGTRTGGLSITDVLLKDDDVRETILERKPYYSFNALHPNTIEVVGRDIMDGPDVLFKKGQMLFCLRDVNIIGVIDLMEEEVVWWMGDEGLIDGAHDPSITKDGNILLFDNGVSRGYSRIVEIDPATKKGVWTYEADPPESFFSNVMGGVQELGNGNYLVTESTKGRAFEVTRDKRVVWEFINGFDDGWRKVVYRMKRYGEGELNNSWNG